jgi:ABC-type nitrate/sulfonate/bicarbonate transport system substrate-binding protein
MKLTTRWSCWAAAALLALGSFGTGLAGCAPPPPLRSAHHRGIGYDSLWLADRLGFITAEGLTIELIDQPGTGGSCRLFELGQVDVFGGTMRELLSSATPRPRPIRAVAEPDIPAGRDVILALGGIDRLRALKGRRVAVEGGPTDVLILAAALQAWGLAPDDVELVYGRPYARAAALPEGRVDAVCTGPPEVESRMSALGLQEVFSGAEVPGTIIDLLHTDPAVARTRRADLAALLRANRRAVTPIRTDPAALQLIATRRGLPAAAIAEQLRGLTLPEIASRSALFAGAGLLHRALARAGETLGKFGPLLQPPAVAVLLDPSVVRPTSFAK